MKTKTGLVAIKNEQGKVRRFAQLYSADLLFRSLCDITLAGVLVLLVTNGINLVPPHGRMTSWFTSTPAPEPAVLASQTKSTVGLAILNSISTLKVRKSELVGPPELLQKLNAAADAVNVGDMQNAEALLFGLDDREPVVAYVKGITAVNKPGTGQIAKAQALLKRATRQGYYPAYLALGAIYYQIVLLHEKDVLPASEQVLVDDADTASLASLNEIAAAADVTWQRAAAFGRPEGLRLAAFAKARGLGGKVDYVAAAAMWKQAADIGDRLSQYELGLLLLNGTGVQANADQAIDLLRQSRDQVPQANLWLALALLPKAQTGDEAAASEGLNSAETALDVSETGDEMGMAHYMSGVYLQHAGPAALRDISKAVDHYEQALGFGVLDAAKPAGDAYAAGLGKPKDLECAYAFYWRLAKAAPQLVSAQLEDITRQIGPDGVARAMNISVGPFWPQPLAKPARTSLVGIIPSEPPAPWRSACLRD